MLWEKTLDLAWQHWFVGVYGCAHAWAISNAYTMEKTTVIGVGNNVVCS